MSEAASYELQKVQYADMLHCDAVRSAHDAGQDEGSFAGRQMPQPVHALHFVP